MNITVKTIKLIPTEFDSVYGATEWLNEKQSVVITPMNGCLHMTTKHDTYVMNINPNQPNMYFAVLRDTTPELCVEFNPMSDELSWYNN